MITIIILVTRIILITFAIYREYYDLEVFRSFVQNFFRQNIYLYIYNYARELYNLLYFMQYKGLGTKYLIYAVRAGFLLSSSHVATT